jgi:transcriptional regulator GlxA family with amidase domain
VARPYIPTHTNTLHLQHMPFGDFIAIRRAFWCWLQELHAALAVHGVEPTRTLLQDERIVRVLRQLDHLPHATRLREADLAKAVGLQAGHFVRIFRQQVGKTPKRYFEGLRRSACRQMLAGSSIPIKEIACEMGFKRLSDFSAWFRRLEGVAPREFRQHHRTTASPL